MPNATLSHKPTMPHQVATLATLATGALTAFGCHLPSTAQCFPPPSAFYAAGQTLGHALGHMQGQLPPYFNLNNPAHFVKTAWELGPSPSFVKPYETGLFTTISRILGSGTPPTKFAIYVRRQVASPDLQAPPNNLPAIQQHLAQYIGEVAHQAGLGPNFRPNPEGKQTGLPFKIVLVNNQEMLPLLDITDSTQASCELLPTQLVKLQNNGILVFNAESGLGCTLKLTEAAQQQLADALCIYARGIDDVGTLDPKLRAMVVEEMAQNQSLQNKVRHLTALNALNQASKALEQLFSAKPGTFTEFLDGYSFGNHTGHVDCDYRPVDGKLQKHLVFPKGFEKRSAEWLCAELVYSLAEFAQDYRLSNCPTAAHTHWDEIVPELKKRIGDDALPMLRDLYVELGNVLGTWALSRTYPEQFDEVLNATPIGWMSARLHDVDAMTVGKIAQKMGREGLLNLFVARNQKPISSPHASGLQYVRGVEDWFEALCNTRHDGARMLRQKAIVEFLTAMYAHKKRIDPQNPMNVSFHELLNGRENPETKYLFIENYKKLIPFYLLSLAVLFLHPAIFPQVPRPRTPGHAFPHS